MKKIQKKKSESLETEIKNVLLTYIKTQALVVAIVTTIIYIILNFLNVGYAGLLAFVSGALWSIPFFGMFLAAILTSLVAIFDNAKFLPNLPAFFEGLTIFIIYILINQLTDYLLAPFLLGKTTGTHPLLTIATVLVATALFGLPGAILAVPALLIVVTVYKYQENTSENKVG
jgi:predicted PurR-regulated permease PerM